MTVTTQQSPSTALSFVPSSSVMQSQAFVARQHSPNSSSNQCKRRRMSHDQPHEEVLCILDTSPSVAALMEFLVEEECDGIGTIHHEEELRHKDTTMTTSLTALGFTMVPHVEPKRRLRGLFATTNVNAGEFLIGIPWTASIRLQDDQSQEFDNTQQDIGRTNVTNEIGNHCSQENAAEIKQAQIFWQEYYHDPRWRRYVACLPWGVKDDNSNNSPFDATPDFWSDSVLQGLPVPAMRREAQQRRAAIEQAVAEWQEKQTHEDEGVETIKSNRNMNVPKGHNMTVSDLQWATWIVRSRGVSVLKRVRSGARRIDNGDGAGCNNNHQHPPSIHVRTFLIPWIDMINHASLDECNAALQVLESADGDEAASMFVIRALRDIDAGEHITICYGTGYETCLDLLSKYGFFVPAKLTVKRHKTTVGMEYEDDVATAVTGDDFLENRVADNFASIDDSGQESSSDWIFSMADQNLDWHTVQPLEPWTATTNVPLLLAPDAARHSKNTAMSIDQDRTTIGQSLPTALVSLRIHLERLHAWHKQQQHLEQQE